MKKIGTLKLLKIENIDDSPYTSLNAIVVGTSMYYYKPIIICDDEIKVGDSFYNNDTKHLGKLMLDDNIYPKLINECNDNNKVLVLPNQFSPETIQLIVDGKLKDGDKVEVEVSEYEDYGEDLDTDKSFFESKELLTFNNGFTIITPYKESVEDAADEWIKEASTLLSIRQAFIAGAKWYKENH